tara:strand:- start:216 stop:665 length:450 start_codon:yes stop_codon:yes gene_type:complete
MSSNNQNEECLSMILGDIEGINTDYVEHIESAVCKEQDDYGNGGDKFRIQLLTMLKTPPPAEMLIKMIYDLSYTIGNRNSEMVIGYDASESEFSYKTEKEWKMLKIKDEIEEGEHLATCGKWVLDYIEENNCLPDGLEEEIEYQESCRG